MICGAWMCACVLKKHYVMWVGGAALSKTVLFLASVHSKLPLGTLSLAFFDSLYAQGLSSVPNDSYIRSTISHDSQKLFKTVFKRYLQTRARLTSSKSIYMQTRMAQKFAFTVLFTLAILGGFARAAPCRFPRTSHQTPSAPSSQTGCETQLLPAQLQELKQQIRGGLVSIRDELEEVVNGTLKGTGVSVACGIANIFMANLQRYRSHCILISSFFYAGSGISNWNICW